MASRTSSKKSDAPSRTASGGALLQRARPAYVVLASAVALIQLRILHHELGSQYRLSVDAARGVIDGEPHWRVFQNRLLGPYLVRALEAVTGSFEQAHVLCTVALLAAAGYLVLRALDQQTGSVARTLAGYASFSLLVVFCFRRPWLYIWDFVDLVVFVLFNWFVAIGESTLEQWGH